MQFNTSSNTPTAEANDKAYFFSRRSYGTPYLMAQYLAPPLQEPAPAPSYAARSATSDGRVQTVEDVITNGYFATPDDDPSLAIIGDRRRATWLGLDDAIRQLRLRYEIYERNLDDIGQAECDAANALHTWRAERGWPSDRQLDNLQRTLQALDGQRREERLSLWKDTSRLRQTLPEWVQRYLSAVRKKDLLDSTVEGRP